VSQFVRRVDLPVWSLVAAGLLFVASVVGALALGMTVGASRAATPGTSASGAKTPP
jgi:hypothetical protein